MEKVGKMHSYDEYIESVSNWDTTSTVQEEAREAAEGAMVFVQFLHDMFDKLGLEVSDEPDIGTLETYIDSMYGELFAACLFLTEEQFDAVPTILRGTGEQIAKHGLNEVVPPCVVRGFGRLAARIEQTRIVKKQLNEAMKERTETP